MSNAAELERLGGWINGLLAGLDGASRARATSKIAAALRGSNAKRIAAQRDPDGQPFAPRRPQKQRKPSNKTLKFLYPSGGSGQARTVLLKSWIKQGALFTGYDAEAGALRSFNRAKIIRWLPVSTDEQNQAARRTARRSTIKQRAMFRKLRSYSQLKAGSTADEAWVGFTGRSAAIARVHHDGGYDKPSAKAPRIRYARRRLIGMSPDDERVVLDILREMLASASV